MKGYFRNLEFEFTNLLSKSLIQDNPLVEVVQPRLPSLWLPNLNDPSFKIELDTMGEMLILSEFYHSLKMSRHVSSSNTEGPVFFNLLSRK